MFIEIGGQYINLNHVKTIQFSTGFEREDNPPRLKYNAKVTFALKDGETFVLTRYVETSNKTADALAELKRDIETVCRANSIYLGKFE